MKLLKVFGVVVGIHVFALILIFANPGCSSASNKAAPAASDTVAKTDTASPTITVPNVASEAPSSFDPNSPAIAISPQIRYSPTRPGTPAAGALEAEPIANVTPASTYTVGKGDSLWTIAKKHHVTVSELAAANNLKPGAPVRLGQKLIIPGKAPGAVSAAPKPADAFAAKPAATSPAARGTGDAVKHIVKPGETLGAIARKYQVRMGDLATANNIADPAKIRPGMELVIPGWQAPAGKSPRPAAKAAPEVPTISVGDDAPPPPKSDAPPTISVEDVPATKNP